MAFAFRSDSKPVIGRRLELLVRIIRIRPQGLIDNLGPYFKMLVKFCAVGGKSQDEVRLIKSAVVAPLGPENDAPGKSLSHI